MCPSVLLRQAAAESDYPDRRPSRLDRTERYSYQGDGARVIPLTANSTMLRNLLQDRFPARDTSRDPRAAVFISCIARTDGGLVPISNARPLSA